MSQQHLLRRNVRRYALGDYGQFAIAAEVTAWAARVILNGGATPSIATQLALSYLINGLKADSLYTSVLMLNMFVPDSLIAAKTPLIQGSSYALWLNSGAGPTLSSSGVTFSAGGNGLNTGFSAPNYGSTTSVGVSLYLAATPTNGTGANTYDFGITNNAGSSALTLSAMRSSVTKLPETACFNFTAGQGDCIGASSLTAGGFLSYQRTSAAACNIYFANGSTACSSIASNANSGGAQPGSGTGEPLLIGCAFLSDSGTPGLGPGNTYSGAAFTMGLSSAQCQALFNRFQSCRKALGGGFV